MLKNKTFGKIVDQPVDNPGPLAGYLCSYVLNPKRPTTAAGDIYFADGFSGVTIHRDGQFQVQLWIAQPNTVIPDHVHPNMDSYEVPLWGMEFIHSGAVILPMKVNYRHRKDGLIRWSDWCIRVRPDDVHAGSSGPEGGAFLSVQHWVNGARPTAPTVDWKGKPLGPDHETILKTNSPEGY